MLNEDCKQRMIESLKKYYSTNTNPYKGHKHSEKTKEILRQKALGRPSAFKGKKHTEEAKEKIRLKHINNNNLGEKNPFYGKKHTEETKKIIGEKNSIKVVQIDKNTNEILMYFNSIK